MYLLTWHQSALRAVLVVALLALYLLSAWLAGSNAALGVVSVFLALFAQSRILDVLRRAPWLVGSTSILFLWQYLLKSLSESARDDLIRRARGSAQNKASTKASVEAMDRSADGAAPWKLGSLDVRPILCYWLFPLAWYGIALECGLYVAIGWDSSLASQLWQKVAL